LAFIPAGHKRIIDFERLKKQGIPISFASDKKEMIDMMRTKEAAAVLATYKSKGNNTVDFLRYIMRQHPNTQRIYLTETLEKKFIESAINKAHINYILVSPVDTDYILEIVQKAFKRYVFLAQPSQRYDDLVGMAADLFEIVNKYKKEASTDQLTKLFNRRSFDKILESAIDLYNDKKIAFSLILIDLDNFKILNDKYGHAIGDKVLQKFGQILNNNMRQEDSAFRYGGEEFAIIASGDILQNIKMFVERIRNQVKNNIVRNGKEEIRFTFSAGIASMHGKLSAEHLIEATDAALYFAKKHGKDQIIIFDDKMLKEAEKKGC
jgi:diguanylate cyclase (GGDEF)-like protein